MVKLNVAIIGCGNIGAKSNDYMRRISLPHFKPLTHLDAIQEHEGLVVDSICDVSEEALNNVSEKISGVSIFTSVEDLLKSKKNKIDIVTIATRTKGRINIVKQCLSAGLKGIHIEKPLCNSESELRIFEKIYKSNSTIFTYGAIRRYLGPYRSIKELLLNKKFGSLNNITINFGHRTLLWTHIHSLDLLNFFSYPSMANEVSARFSKIDDAVKNSEYFNDPVIESLIINYDNNSKGLITNSSGMEVILNCSLGMLVAGSDGLDTVFRTKLKDNPYFNISKKIKLNKYKYNGHASPLNVLFNAINGDEEAISISKKSILSAINGMRIAFSAVKSHEKNGAFVKVGDYPKEIYLHGGFDGKYA